MTIRRTPRPLGLYAQTFVFGLIVVPIVLALAFLPLVSCPNCGPLYRTRLAYSELPGMSAADSAYLRRYAASDWKCGLCTEHRRVPMVVRVIRWFFRPTG